MMKRRDFIEKTTWLAGMSIWPTLVNTTSTITSGQFELEEITIAQLQAAYKNKKYTIPQVVQMYLQRIEQIDRHGPQLNSVITTNPDAILIAEALQKDLDTGNSLGPLHGIPILLKDNIDTHDQMMTTAGSKALLGHYPLLDSGVAAQLREAGAVILGKANLSEWANFRGNSSSSGWSGIGGQTHNPYDLTRNPCGSSAGSGAATSANLCVLAIGTETNGSIVCPSTINGLVGIKPTVGLISRAGIIPISHTQDTAGPMARTVADAAICLGTLTSEDPRDSATLNRSGMVKKDYTQALRKDGLQGKTLALLTGTMDFNPLVDDLIHQVVKDVKAQGAEVIEIEKIVETSVRKESFDVLLYEFKDGLNKYLATLHPSHPIKTLSDIIEFNKKDPIELLHFGQELLELADSKGDLETEEYQIALKKMLKAYREEGIDRVMKEHALDAFIAPTGSPAWKTDWVNGDHFSGGSSSPAARSGYPSITVPMGFVNDLPVGVSFFGDAWSEASLIEIAYAYEQATQHRKPPLFRRG